MDGYKSVERRVWDGTEKLRKNIVNFSLNLAYHYYQGASVFFRLPTTMRKAENDQFVRGYIGSINPFSIISFGLVSGIYELGRLKQSKAEYKALQEKKKLEEKIK